MGVAPSAARFAVVVGNGFTIDYVHRAGLRGAIDVSSPLRAGFRVPQQPDLSLLDALPRFRDAVAAARTAHRGDEPDFDLLRRVVGAAVRDDRRAEIEARHYLVMAYRQYADALNAAPTARWAWLDWFRAHAPALVATVSFNYDTLLERTLSLSGVAYNRHHDRLASGVVPVFKPHGSVDFDVEGLWGGPQRYPLRLYAHRSSAPLRIIAAAEWPHPPAEPLVVLPYEQNPYSQLQWAGPGYDLYKRIARGVTHAIFVGLAYHEADQPEIDYFLNCTPDACRVVVANPSPHPDFVEAVERSGRHLTVWQRGPEDLPPL